MCVKNILLYRNYVNGAQHSYATDMQGIVANIKGVPCRSQSGIIQLQIPP